MTIKLLKGIASTHSPVYKRIRFTSALRLAKNAITNYFRRAFKSPKTRLVTEGEVNVTYPFLHSVGEAVVLGLQLCYCRHPARPQHPDAPPDPLVVLSLSRILQFIEQTLQVGVNLCLHCEIKSPGG